MLVGFCAREALGRFSWLSAGAALSTHSTRPGSWGTASAVRLVRVSRCWLRDRRCWPGGQETSVSAGFGNGLIEVFVWCHTLDGFDSVRVFRGKIHVICMFQKKNKLGCKVL